MRPPALNSCRPALQQLHGSDAADGEMAEILQEQAASTGERPRSLWELLRDQAVRWQLGSVMIVSSAMQLCGNDAVSYSQRAAGVGDMPTFRVAYSVDWHWDIAGQKTELGKVFSEPGWLCWFSASCLIWGFRLQMPVLGDGLLRVQLKASVCTWFLCKAVAEKFSIGWSEFCQHLGFHLRITCVWLSKLRHCAYDHKVMGLNPSAGRVMSLLGPWTKPFTPIAPGTGL